jgi:hypothetical protein
MEEVIEALMRLQQKVAQARGKEASVMVVVDKDAVAMAALASQALCEQLETLNDELRQCAGTYWRDAPPAPPAPGIGAHSSLSKGYRGPPREGGEAVALCDSCGSKLHRDNHKRKKASK